MVGQFKFYQRLSFRNLEKGRQFCSKVFIQFNLPTFLGIIIFQIDFQILTKSHLSPLFKLPSEWKLILQLEIKEHTFLMYNYIHILYF